MILGCSNDIETNQIVGQWKLIYRQSNPWSNFISDESAKNIVYDFKSNGILIVNWKSKRSAYSGAAQLFFW